MWLCRAQWLWKCVSNQLRGHQQIVPNEKYETFCLFLGSLSFMSVLYCVHNYAVTRLASFHQSVK